MCEKPSALFFGCARNLLCCCAVLEAPHTSAKLQWQEKKCHKLSQSQEKEKEKVTTVLPTILCTVQAKFAFSSFIPAYSKQQFFLDNNSGRQIAVVKYFIQEQIQFVLNKKAFRTYCTVPSVLYRLYVRTANINGKTDFKGSKCLVP